MVTPELPIDDPPSMGRCPVTTTEEIARLRAEVAWLQAERSMLWQAACHDELTGLPNRRLFAALAPSMLAGDRPAVVIVLDLNGFKPINDRLGHHTGDLVLQVIAQRLSSCVGDSLTARLGGDEFAVVLTGSPCRPGTPWWQPVAHTLSTTIAAPIAVPGESLTVTAAIGAAPSHVGVPFDDLLQHADLAMYRAKTQGHPVVAWRPRSLQEAGLCALPEAPTPAAVESSVPATAEASVEDPVEESLEQTIEFNVFPATEEVSHSDLPRRLPPGETYQRETYQYYRKGDPVWVNRDGTWCPGVVESASSRAVTATYQPNDSSGTMVDTVVARHVQARVAA